MKHIIYSKEAIDLIKSRMPDEFYRYFVDKYYGTTMTLETLSYSFGYSVRQMERISKKVREMVEAMPDIVNGDVKK